MLISSLTYQFLLDDLGWAFVIGERKKKKELRNWENEETDRFSSSFPAGSDFGPWVGKIPRRREWLPTPVFLPGESHGQRSLEGYSPWSCKELDPTE